MSGKKIEIHDSVKTINDKLIIMYQAEPVQSLNNFLNLINENGCKNRYKSKLFNKLKGVDLVRLSQNISSKIRQIENTNEEIVLKKEAEEERKV